jgi:hypothetical protein
MLFLYSLCVFFVLEVFKMGRFIATATAAQSLSPPISCVFSCLWHLCGFFFFVGGAVLFE